MPIFTPAASDLKAAEELLKKEGYDSSKKYVLVCPGSSDQERNWQIEKFAETANSLHKTNGVGIIIGGSTQEKHATEALKKLLSFPVVDLTGKTTLPIFGAICTKAKVYVGNDTGTTHLAGAFGLPVVCIMGGGINRFFPYGDPKTHIAVYDNDLYAETAKEPRMRYQSMYAAEKNVKVSQVLDAVREVLERTPNDTNH